MKKSVKIGIGVALVAVAGVFAFVGIRAAQRRNDELGNIPRTGIAVEAEAAHRETIVTKVSAKGTASLIDQSIIYAQSTAKVSAVTVKVGDTVTAGQILARYDEETLETLAESLGDASLSLRSAQINLRNAGLPASETELLQAEQSIRSAEKTISDLEAQIEQTDISLDQVRRNLERTTETHAKNMLLFDQGLLSQSDLDASADAVTKLQDQIDTSESQRQTQVQALLNAKENLALTQKQYNAVADKTGDPKVQSQIDLQHVQIDQAQRQIDKIQKDIDKFVAVETSPIDGVVLSVAIQEGETAQAGRVLFTIADIRNQNLVLTVYIPESDAAGIALGQTTEITGGALGSDIYEGVVSKIYPVAEMRPIGSSQETAITIEVSSDDAQMPMKAGYTVDTNVITNVAENVVVVPLMSVITEGGGQSYVYIMTADYIAERRDVVLKSYANLYVEVEGVDEGEMVIVNPSGEVQPGVTVRPAY